MKYIELGENEKGVMIFGRVDDDGLMRVTCIFENPDYQAWLNPAEQSTPNLPEQVCLLDKVCHNSIWAICHNIGGHNG